MDEVLRVGTEVALLCRTWFVVKRL